MLRSFCARSYVRLLLSSAIFVNFFGSFKLVKNVPKRVKIHLFIFGRMLGLLVLSKTFFSIGYLLMDELQRAVAQFYYPTSGGINEGGFSQPPTPTPPPENSGLGLIPGAKSEEDRTNSNHYPAGSSQEAHQDEAGTSGTATTRYSLRDFRQLLDDHAIIAKRIQEIHQDLKTRVPAGFQAERLAEILEERHGGEKMNEILRSLQTEGRQSPYFREVQTDFRTLRNSGGTEEQLRKEWQGRAS